MKPILGEHAITQRRLEGHATPVVILPPHKQLAQLFLEAIGCDQLDADALFGDAWEPDREPKEQANVLALGKALKALNLSGD